MIQTKVYIRCTPADGDKNVHTLFNLQTNQDFIASKGAGSAHSRQEQLI